jgi:hypothetical protein
MQCDAMRLFCTVDAVNCCSRVLLLLLMLLLQLFPLLYLVFVRPFASQV